MSLSIQFNYSHLYAAGKMLVGGFNLKGVSFIPLLARLAIEFGVLFDGEEERGGLLCQDYENENENVLHYLVASDRSEHRELVDDKYLQVLMQLRKKGLLKKGRHSKLWPIERILFILLFCRETISIFDRVGSECIDSTQQGAWRCTT
jgi:hypothetical protein